MRGVVDIGTKRYNAWGVISKRYRGELILVPNDVELNNDRADLILVPNDVELKKLSGGVDIGTKRCD